MPRQIKVLPECVYGNKCSMVCINSQCRKPGFLCEGGTTNKNECALFHDECSKMNWSEMEQLIHENPNIKSVQFSHVEEAIEQIFSRLIKRVQAEHLRFKIWVRTYGYSAEVLNFIDLINKGQFSSISGVFVNSIMSEVFMKDKHAELPQIKQQEVQTIFDQAEHLFDSIGELYNKSNRRTAESIPRPVVNSPFSKSRVIQDYAFVQSLFEKQKLKTASMLFRASENNYSVAQFHMRCDDIPNTMTVLQTEFGKVIGGFTALPWNSSKKHWAADKEGRSFLFSISLKERYTLNLPQFAIACNSEKGPIFGCCDICIVDNSNTQKSNAQFPISYNNFKHARNPNTSLAFTGHPKGRFVTKEWEVWQIEF